MNRRLTIGLVVVFAALAVYVLVVQVPKDNASSATPTVVATSFLKPTLRADQVKAVHVVDRVQGKQVDLVKDASGSWSLTNPGPQPASQVLAASNVSALMTLATDGTITTATDLSAFGVLSPTLTVEVDMADGTSLKAAVGDKTPTGSDYYTLRAGETQVVLLSTAAQGTLESLVTTPPVVPPTGTLTPGPGTPSATPAPLETATSALAPTQPAATAAAVTSAAATSTLSVTTAPPGSATP